MHSADFRTFVNFSRTGKDPQSTHNPPLRLLFHSISSLFRQTQQQTKML